ncbi:mannose-1-phosphate guanylyltransferase [Hyphococcus flavus]|uniref:mannose-1-phosphate guanylyltransferase n=1 Tax=Hyphococcus flavus TaxID=1866326 RepID=A0AAE9ZAU3_9PROT|nr:mannose-1-phosphate guanylyltransferase [Hyphococcus flavus]WDI30451.1 mannose-1-phosphate guanylyltransferase [Hyphococcus flavus]
MKIQPVIMSGGSGTRLWPLSRRARPKQFLNLAGKHTLFQDTVLRLIDDNNIFTAPLIIAGKNHADIVSEQLSEINIQPADIILEPSPRNTAPVAAVAAAWTKQNNPDAVIFLSPADHYIGDSQKFRDAILNGAEAAQKGFIVTFGVKPTHAHTGYGYIKCGGKLTNDVLRVDTFKEKPDAKTAQGYLTSGGYYWNAGLFLFNPQTILDEFSAQAPEVAVHASKAFEHCSNLEHAHLLEDTAFKACPSVSLDYAIMEKTDRAAIVPALDIGWNDIGSWSEVMSESESKHLLHNADNVTVHSGGPIVGAIGVEDLIIVATADAVLVARKDNAQDVRVLVEELKKRGREDLL